MLTLKSRVMQSKVQGDENQFAHFLSFCSPCFFFVVVRQFDGELLDSCSRGNSVGLKVADEK